MTPVTRVGDFRCPLTHRCIAAHWRCDGEFDCGDGADEFNCTDHRACTDAEFRCTNGRCTALAFVCNGFDDCGDLSDEQDSLNCCMLELHCCATLRELGCCNLVLPSLWPSCVVFAAAIFYDHDNNINGFKVRFSVERRHRGPPSVTFAAL